MPVYELNTLKAFPTAYGGGQLTSGGRNGDLIIVDTLDRNAALVQDGTDSTVYRGGFFSALQHPNPAYIVFDVSGNIQLGVGGTSSEFSFGGMTNVNNKTILGQTAPLGGITLTGGTFRINGRFGDGNELIFRHLRSRPILNQSGNLDTSDDAYTWAFLFYGGNNIVLDSCSASFAQDKAIGGAIDEAVSPNTMNNHTYSNNLVLDSGTSMYVEVNPNRPEDPENFVDDISFIENVSGYMNRTPNMSFTGNGEVINNVAYGIPGKAISSYHGIKLNQIGNYYQTFGSGGWNRILLYFSEDNTPEIFSEGNYFEGTSVVQPTDDQKLMWIDEFLNSNTPPASITYFTNTKHSFNYTEEKTLLTPSETFTKLVNNKKVGARKCINDDGTVTEYRDSLDESQLNLMIAGSNYSIKNPSNWVLPTIPNNTRPSNYYNTVLGIPEWFVQQHNITSRNQIVTNWDFGSYQVINNAGYPAIEIYGAWIAGDFEELDSSTVPNNGGNQVEGNGMLIFLINL